MVVISWRVLLIHFCRWLVVVAFAVIVSRSSSLSCFALPCFSHRRTIDVRNRLEVYSYSRRCRWFMLQTFLSLKYLIQTECCCRALFPLIIIGISSESVNHRNGWQRAVGRRNASKLDGSEEKVLKHTFSLSSPFIDSSFFDRHWKSVNGFSRWI